MKSPFQSWQLKIALPLSVGLWLLAYAAWLSLPADKNASAWNRFLLDLGWQIQMPAVASVLTFKWAKSGLDEFVDYGTPSLRSLAIVAPFLVVIQVVMGALLRQGIWGATPHVLGAMLTGGFLLYFSTGVITPAPKGHPAKLLAMTVLWLSLAQIMLGIAAYVVKFAGGVPGTTLFSNLHIISGTMTLAATAALSIILRRCVRTQEVSALASTRSA